MCDTWTCLTPQLMHLFIKWRVLQMIWHNILYAVLYALSWCGNMKTNNKRDLDEQHSVMALSPSGCRASTRILLSGKMVTESDARGKFMLPPMWYFPSCWLVGTFGCFFLSVSYREPQQSGLNLTPYINWNVLCSLPGFHPYAAERLCAPLLAIERLCKNRRKIMIPS